MHNKRLLVLPMLFSMLSTFIFENMVAELLCQFKNVTQHSLLSILNVPDEGYSRSASLALNLISTFVLFLCSIL